eukprot:3643205-Rhodomonas_salina.1
MAMIPRASISRGEGRVRGPEGSLLTVFFSGDQGFRVPGSPLIVDTLTTELSPFIFDLRPLTLRNHSLQAEESRHWRLRVHAVGR